MRVWFCSVCKCRQWHSRVKSGLLQVRGLYKTIGVLSERSAPPPVQSSPCHRVYRPTPGHQAQPNTGIELISLLTRQTIIGTISFRLLTTLCWLVGWCWVLLCEKVWLWLVIHGERAITQSGRGAASWPITAHHPFLPRSTAGRPQQVQTAF